MNTALLSKIAQALSILFLLALIGCAGADQRTYDDYLDSVLSASKQTYNATMESVSELQGLGYISAEDRVEINEVAGKYRLAHMSAAEAWYSWKVVQTAEAQDRLDAAVKELTKRLTELTQFVLMKGES